MSHALLAPSAAERWIRCPASPAMAADYTDEPGPYAAEGTAAHTLAAAVLRDGGTPADHIGEEYDGHTVDQDMADAVQQYTDAITAAAEGATELWIEETISITEWIPDTYGTADAVIIDGTASEAQIHDLKYGRGVLVSASGNAQLRLYGLGVLTLAHLLGYSIDAVRLVIHQPRRNHRDEETLDQAALIDWARSIRPTAETAHRLAKRAAEPGGVPSAELYPQCAPGDVQCRWCPARAECRALAESVQQTVAGELFDRAPPEPDAPSDPARLDSDDIAALLPHLDAVEQWARAVRQRAVRDLSNGVEIPGYKLVAGRRGSRQWIDPETVEYMLLKHFRLPKKHVYTQKLATPAQIEKVIGSRRYQKIEPYIQQTGGAPVVAPGSDKRPALSNIATASEFDEE